MNKNRLLRLAHLLEADAANPSGVKFDLDQWAVDARVTRNSSPSEREKFLYALDTAEVPLDCRTAACAMGLAALSGAFKGEGLEWRISGSGYLIPTFEDIVGGREVDGYEAAELLFEIPYRATEKLFSSDYYPEGSRKGRDGELAVAARIRDYVNGTYDIGVEDDD